TYAHPIIPINIKKPKDSEIFINYYSSNTKDLLKDYLNAFKKRLGYDGDFEKIEKGNQTLYYAHYEDDVFRTYAGYILNEKGTGGIEVIYNIDCQDERKAI